MGDVVFNVSPQGTDASKASSPSQLLMSAKYPFHKLDTTKDVSFQNFLFTFSKTPALPTPASAPSLISFASPVTIYTFAHGYSYTPATWVMDLNNYEAPDTSTFPAYQNGNLILLSDCAGDSHGGATYIYLWVTADATNVYFKLITEMLSADNGSGVGMTPTPAASITGFTAKVRVYCFAEDLQTS